MFQDELYFTNMIGAFEPGKTYAITADDTLWNGPGTDGDVQETIGDYSSPSNNYFIFKYPSPTEGILSIRDHYVYNMSDIFEGEFKLKQLDYQYKKENKFGEYNPGIATIVANCGVMLINII